MRLNRFGFILIGCVFEILCTAGAEKSTGPSTLHHYVFFNRDRERVKESSFLSTKAFEGAQLKYTWRELEPQKERYDFAALRDDYAFLAANGKRLFIQLQDSSFDDKIINVPEYLRREPEFNGGADRQYLTDEGKEDQAAPAGWVARRYDPAVQRRFHKLLVELAKEFDGKIHGINFAETSVDFGETGRLYPKGFTPLLYRDAIITNMVAAKAAFQKSIVMQYANFMPGEWLPEDDHGFLKSVFARAKDHQIAVGAPDLLPFKPGQMKHAYPLLRDLSGVVPTGIAVQWGNYEHRNPMTGKQVTIPELIAFAQEHLRVTYVFWCTQEPFYSNQFIPFLATQIKKEKR
jgi:hypothetical protein